MMNEQDLVNELIDNVKDNRFAIVEFEQVPNDGKRDDAKHAAFVKLRIVDEDKHRLIVLTEKGYRQVDNNNNDEQEWFETLSTLLQEKSEAFRQEMMKTLLSKLSNLE